MKADPGKTDSRPSEGKLIIFSAPSGAGKTTIVRYLLDHLSQLEFSVSATTRIARAGEKNGRDYYFLSKDEFLHRIAKKEFVEFEEVYNGTFYGTLKSELERIWASGKHVVFDMDVEGGLHLKRKYGTRALSIFVKPPSLKVLIERLHNRATDSVDKIQERIAKASKELEYERYFDEVLLNEDLEATCTVAHKLVEDFISGY